MKVLKNITFLFVVALIANACKKDLSISNLASTSQEEGQLKIPENFFKEGVVPGVANTSSAVPTTATFSSVTAAAIPPLDNGDEPVVLGNQLSNP